MALLKRTLHRGLIFDENGDYLGTQKIKYNSNKFTYKGHSFIFSPNMATTYTEDRWYLFHEKVYYYYNINNPEPLKLKQNYNPQITSEELNTFLDTEVLRKLNDLAKQKWWENLFTTTNIIIAIVLIGVAYWYFGIKQGKL